MFRQAINWILIACVVLGIYKAFGGDIGAFVSATGDIVLTIVEQGSNIIAKIWNSVFK